MRALPPTVNSPSHAPRLTDGPSRSLMRPHPAGQRAPFAQYPALPDPRRHRPMDLTDQIVERVLARLYHAPAPAAAGLLPCALPPPGSPRRAGVLEALDRPPVSSEPRGRQLARWIDHTLLRPEAGREAIERLCQEARAYGFATVCVHPSWVGFCAERLGGSPVGVCAVVGFPSGATTPSVKAFETREVVAAGACEIDMVAHLGRLRDHAWLATRDDVAAVVEAAGGRPVKVILETGLLTEEEKIAGAIIAREAGAAFVKTSTGFGPGGATIEDVCLLRRVIGPAMGLKAAGGIRTAEAGRSLLRAGATRLGCSGSVALIEADR